MKHLLTGFELNKDEYLKLIDQAIDMKANAKAYQNTLCGMSGAIMFEKPSLRTRTTFELALFKLGAHGVYLDLQSGDLGKRESIADYARNLSRWCDCLISRVFAQSTLEQLAQYSKANVINALSDLYHPAQAMADYMTVFEKFKKYENLKLTYLGDGNNVANSLIIAGAILGVNVTCITPKGHSPCVQIINQANEFAKKNGSKIVISDDINEAKNSDILYTDTWVSMGDNTPLDEVKKLFMPYQLNEKLIDFANCQMVLHCLPAHRGYEITDEAMDGEKSHVFDEAENRLHIHMSLLYTLLKNK